MRLARVEATGKPYKVYAENIESSALDQFIRTMECPEVVQGALMPDVHSGYTVPIGSVFATRGAIFPSFVGFDIGCGMCALPTAFKRVDVEANAKAIFDQIYRDVPVGFNHNKESVNWVYDGGGVSDFVAKEIAFAGAPGKQIGTLGSGNHFIEIGADETDRVWIIIHSGSRNVGHKIASHYMRIANDEFLVRQGKQPDGKKREGHYALYEGTPSFDDYRADLMFAQEFALANRKMIMRRVVEAMFRKIDTRGCNMVDWGDLINRNHNHAEYRAISHAGPTRDMMQVWIHRKGATHAEKGMMGVIPGNMRDGSFIVRGKGNPEALFSSSHGAGRVLSRTAAKDTVSLDDFKETMKGIQAKVCDATRDESPFAYKDIFQVMKDQQDLVEVVAHVKPIINIKG